MLSVIVMMFFSYRFSECCHSDNKIVAMPTDKVQHCDYIRSNCKRFFLVSWQHGCYYIRGVIKAGNINTLPSLCRSFVYNRYGWLILSEYFLQKASSEA